MNLMSLRILLAQWGVMSRARGIGYPTMAATEKARIGRGGVWAEPELPPDLVPVDRAVARSLPQHKLIIVECYTKPAPWREHAARLQLTEPSYFRRKKMAEMHIYSLLHGESDSVISGAR